MGSHDRWAPGARGVRRRWASTFAQRQREGHVAQQRIVGVAPSVALALRQGCASVALSDCIEFVTRQVRGQRIVGVVGGGEVDHPQIIAEPGLPVNQDYS